MASKSSNEEYDMKLFLKEIDCIRIENYINARTPILHEGFCGHTWKASPDNILRGKRCPTCFGKTKKTTQGYKQELIQKKINFQVLEEYVNDKTPILHSCVKGHSWKAQPTHILNSKTGCPKCMTSGFSKSLPAILYYVKIIKNNETYYKIGVTNRSVKERFIREKDKEITSIMEKQFETGEDALLAEKKILDSYPRVSIDGFLKSSGNTELFEYDILELDTPGAEILHYKHRQD